MGLIREAELQGVLWKTGFINQLWEKLGKEGPERRGWGNQRKVVNLPPSMRGCHGRQFETCRGIYLGNQINLLARVRTTKESW